MNTEEKKRQNRERMPQIAEVYDKVVKVFGVGVKVVYAKENGYEIGRKQ